MFSFIVPVYNVEPYLASCLNSLLPAVEKHDEILLVQGNSDDGSLEISRRYQETHDCIRLLGQDGKGLSNARNCGLRVAKEDYVLFIDSDDFVNTADLAKLLDALRSGEYTADVVMTDFYMYNEANGKEWYVKHIGGKKLEGLKALPQAITERQCFWNVWRNVYRKSFLLKNQLFFQENTHGEDIDYMTRVFLSRPEIVFVNVAFYRYRIGRRGSLMNSVSLSRVSETVSILEQNISRLRTLQESWCTPLISGYQFEYILNMALIQELRREQREAAANLFHAYRQVLLPTDNQWVQLLAWWTGLLGVPKMSQALSFAKRIKRKREHRAP